MADPISLRIMENSVCQKKITDKLVLFPSELSRIFLEIGKKKKNSNNIVSLSGRVYLDRYTIKFGNNPLCLVNHNPEYGIPAIVSNTMGNSHQGTGCGGDILDMDGDCNTDVCSEICSDSECLVSKSKDSSSMDNPTRIVLTRTVHCNTCIAIMCLGYLHTQ